MTLRSTLGRHLDGTRPGCRRCGRLPLFSRPHTTVTPPKWGHRTGEKGSNGGDTEIRQLQVALPPRNQGTATELD